MRVLVTGSSGFVARFLIAALLERDYEVVGIDKRPGDIAFGSRYSCVRGSVLDEKVVDKAMAGVDLALHLAAEHKDFGVPKRRYFDVNVGGTKILLDAAERHGVERFLFYSSVAVYGGSREASNEEQLPKPTSAYGESKLRAEEIVVEWAGRSSRRSALIIRPTVIFGPFNRANMYSLISAIASGCYIRVGREANKKSLAYVENIVFATLYLLDRQRAGVDVYNYADSPDLTSGEIADRIATELGVRIPMFRVPKALALAIAYSFDFVAAVTKKNVPITSKKIRKYMSATEHRAARLAKTGFVPPLTLAEGFRRTISWYKVAVPPPPASPAWVLQLARYLRRAAHYAVPRAAAADRR